MGICVLNLSERGLTDDRLNHLLALAPEVSNHIISLLDILLNIMTQMLVWQIKSDPHYKLVASS